VVFRVRVSARGLTGHQPLSDSACSRPLVSKLQIIRPYPERAIPPHVEQDVPRSVVLRCRKNSCPFGGQPWPLPCEVRGHPSPSLTLG
jgi:hypothetical protein